MSKKLFQKINIPSPEEIEIENAWIKEQIEKVGPDRIYYLVELAVRARQFAYTPESGYAVGASLLCKSGNVYSAANIETPRRSPTLLPQQALHAEENTIVVAINYGEIERSGQKFIRVVVVSHKGKTSPCAICRQKMTEHCDNALIVVADEIGNVCKITSLKRLLPDAFTPVSLGIE